jgi:hypothetical protein
MIPYFEMSIEVLFDFINRLIIFLGITALAMGFIYMYMEAKGERKE